MPLQRRYSVAYMVAYMVVLLLLIFPIAFATTQTIILKQDQQDACFGPSAVYPIWWQTFKIPQRCKIEVVELYLMKNGTVTGFTLGFYYWNTSANTLGDKIYEQSFSSIPTTYTKTNYTLSSPVQLNNSLTTYALYIKQLGGSTEYDCIFLKISTANPYSDGIFYGLINGAPDPKNDYDLYFILYGQLLADPVSIVYEFLPVIILIAMLGVALSMFKDLQK